MAGTGSAQDRSEPSARSEPARREPTRSGGSGAVNGRSLPGGANGPIPSILRLQALAGNRATIKVLQRAVGFEFEDQTWTVLKSQQGKAGLRDPTSWDPRHWWVGGRAAPPGSEKTDDEKAEEKYSGKNVYESGAGSHVNNVVGPYDLQTGPKKGSLHAGPGYKIEPDGPYSDVGGVSNRMDLEIVTDPFPETAAGAEKLETTLADMRAVFNRYNAHASGAWDGKASSLSTARLVGPDKHRFSTPSIYLLGGQGGGHFKPQVTGGISLAQLPGVMSALGVASPDEDRTDEKDQVRQQVYGQANPAALAKTSTLFTLGNAPTRASRVVGGLVAQAVLPERGRGQAELVGFLSLAIVYMTVLCATSKEGIKTQLPLMSRFPMDKVWGQVPEETRNVFHSGTARREMYRLLDPEIALSVRAHLDRKYPGVTVPGRDGGLGASMLYPDPRLEKPFRDFLGGMTRYEWLEMVVAGGVDLLEPAALINLLKDAPDHGATVNQYDKSIAIFLRGHGNTKNVKKVEGEDEGSLALLENRNVTNGPMTFDQAATFARFYFSWMRRIKEGR